MSLIFFIISICLILKGDMATVCAMNRWNKGNIYTVEQIKKKEKRVLYILFYGKEYIQTFYLKKQTYI